MSKNYRIIVKNFQNYSMVKNGQKLPHDGQKCPKVLHDGQ
jgi:hypothetical protein